MKKQTHRNREQTSGYQCGEGKGRGNIGVEVQTIMHKISYNYKWSITFKNCEFTVMIHL